MCSSKSYCSLAVSRVCFFRLAEKTTRRNSKWGELGGTSPQESKALLLYTNKVSKITNNLTKYTLVNTLTEVSELTN